MNLAEILVATADHDPDRVALVGRHDHAPVTYGQLAARSGAVAARLAIDVSPGDRVAIVAGNEPAFVVANLAAMRAGAVAVPLNVASPAQEVAHELAAVSPSSVVASPAHSDLSRRALAQHDSTIALFVLVEAAAGGKDPAPVTRGPASPTALL